MGQSATGVLGEVHGPCYGLYPRFNLLQQPRGSAGGPQGGGTCQISAVLLPPGQCAGMSAVLLVAVMRSALITFQLIFLLCEEEARCYILPLHATFL